MLKAFVGLGYGVLILVTMAHRRKRKRPQYAVEIGEVHLWDKAPAPSWRAEWLEAARTSPEPKIARNWQMAISLPKVAKKVGEV